MSGYTERHSLPVFHRKEFTMKRPRASDDASLSDLPSPSIGVTRQGLVYDVDNAVLSKGLTRRGFFKVSALAGATLIVAPGFESLFPLGTAQAASVGEFSFAIIADSHTMG